jgi:Flp pilus assembly protein TadG
MRSDRRRRVDRGMVTAELAASLPVLVLLLAVALSAAAVASARVRVQDAAREAARASARGDDAAARALARDAAPGARLELTRTGDDITAVASVRIRLPVPFLPAVTVDERAVAAREPP